MLFRHIVHPPKGSAPRVALLAGILVLFPLSAARGHALVPPPPASSPGAVTAPATFASPAAGQAGFGPLDPAPPKDINDDTGKPDGEYQQVTDIVFSDDGARTEHVIFAPANTIQKVIMTENDFADIEHRLPFVLTTPELPEYDLTYLGRQKVDDIDTYVFDCRPKVLEKNKRYFQGKVWVDQQEYEIVLINGKAVPDNLKRGHEDLSPPYTTYYQEVDGGNWFPVYTKADGVLHFPAEYGSMGQDVHLRYVVKYEDYKRFHAKSRIIYNGEDLPPADPNAKPGTTPAAMPAPAPDASPSALPPPDPDAPPLTRPSAKPN
jgi:hypothetical protein